MNTLKRISSFAIVLALAVISSFAQNRTNFAGVRRAVDYAYGITVPGLAGATAYSPGSAATPPLYVDIGTTATGSGTIILAYGVVTAGDGTQFMPLSITAPIIVGGPTNSETVTPSAVSCATPSQYSTCAVTATFANVHGRGEPVTSGTVGLQEAINIEGNIAGGGGGDISVDPFWAAAGGTTAMLKAASVFSAVQILDTRSTAQSFWWSAQPTTLTLLAAPAVLSAATIASGTAVGTWTAADTFFCITYIDILGGEGPCSPTYDVTLTASVAVNVTATASPASTGAVGWRLYAGASYALAYLLPITSANCTLTTLENLIPACAIGAPAVFPTANTTTTQLKPAPTTPLAAANNIVPQGHTTFAYMPTGSNPVAWQTNFGPFAAMSGGTTAGQVAVLGTTQFPTGYLNSIGRTIRVSGKIIGTVNTATTPSVLIKLGWAGGDTAGVGITLATIIDTVAYGASATFNHNFSCMLTTNAVGATAVGSIQPNCTLTYTNQTGATVGVAISDNANAAVGSLGLFSQDTLYVYYTGATNTTSSLQLMDLHIETVL